MKHTEAPKMFSIAIGNTDPGPISDTTAAPKLHHIVKFSCAIISSPSSVVDKCDVCAIIKTNLAE